MITLEGQNWLITPAALAVGEHAPASIYDQQWLLVLSGVVEVELQGTSNDHWLNSTIDFLPDMAGPLNWAINNWHVQQPPLPYERLAFSLVGWAPFVSLSSIFDAHQSIDAGFAVNGWRPTHFESGTDAHKSPPFDQVSNIFAGITVDLAVRDTDAFIKRIGYNVTLLGRIIFYNTSPLASGPFHAGYRLIRDVPREKARGMQAIVYYPATQEGENTAFAPAGPFPLIGYSHGNRNLGFTACPGTPTDFSVDYRQLSIILLHLARWGYVTIATDQSATSSLEEKAGMLEASVNFLRKENARNRSPFEGQLNLAETVLLGHSTGGGAAIFLARSTQLDVAAVATLSPGGEKSDAASLAAPLLIELGSEEGEEGGNGQGLYAAAPAPKHFIFIKGANHYGYTDELCVEEAPPATIARNDQQRIAYAYLTVFLQRYVRGVTFYDGYLNGSRDVSGLEAFTITVESST